MQTTYRQVLAKAVKGQPLSVQRKSRPLQLPQLPQITRMTVANGAATDDLVVTFVDDLSGQSYSVTATGSANEATLGTNLSNAVAASGNVSKLFSVALVQSVNASDLIVDFTARHANRDYTISATGGTGAITFSESQAAGGDGLEFGQLVARGTEDDEFAAMTASTTVSQIAGFLFRTDANHFHSLENDTPDAVDRCERGKHYAIAEEGEFWIEVAEAVTPASRVFVRVEGTDVGDWGDTAAGGQQLWTLTPTASEDSFGIEFDYGGRHYTAVVADEADGSYTATEICDDLRTALGTITGLTIGGTATLTIQTAAGTELTGLRSIGVGVFASITETTGEDVDMLDVSSIARYTSSAGAGELAKVKIRIL